MSHPSIAGEVSLLFMSVEEAQQRRRKVAGVAGPCRTGMWYWADTSRTFCRHQMRGSYFTAWNNAPRPLEYFD